MIKDLLFSVSKKDFKIDWFSGKGAGAGGVLKQMRTWKEVFEGMVGVIREKEENPELVFMDYLDLPPMPELKAEDIVGVQSMNTMAASGESIHHMSVRPETPAMSGMALNLRYDPDDDIQFISDESKEMTDEDAYMHRLGADDE